MKILFLINQQVALMEAIYFTYANGSPGIAPVPLVVVMSVSLTEIFTTTMFIHNNDIKFDNNVQILVSVNKDMYR